MAQRSRHGGEFNTNPSSGFSKRRRGGNRIREDSLNGNYSEFNQDADFLENDSYQTTTSVEEPVFSNSQSVPKATLARRKSKLPSPLIGFGYEKFISYIPPYDPTPENAEGEPDLNYIVDE